MFAVYQDNASSLSIIQKLSSKFKRGRQSIEGDLCAGGLACANSEKFKATPSACKLMVTVFQDFKGILLIEYTKKGQNITSTSDTNTLCNQVKGGINRKRRGKLTAGVLLHKGRVAKRPGLWI